MRKTPHGKRHIRARATVAIGRQNRRQKKLIREMEQYRLFFKNFPNILIEAVHIFASAMSQFAEAVSICIPIVLTEMERVVYELSKAKTTS